jgi:hypothetical protein
MARFLGSSTCSYLSDSQTTFKLHRMQTLRYEMYYEHNSIFRKTVRNHQCISCLQCTSGQSCPVEIQSTCHQKKNRRENQTRLVGMIIFFVIFGSIALTSSLDLWKTTKSRNPARYYGKKSSEQNGPARIRESYTRLKTNVRCISN